MPQSRRRNSVRRSPCGAPFTRLLAEVLGDLFLRRLHGEAVEKVGIDQRALAGIGLIGDGEALGVGARRQHHRHHGQSIGARKFEVALIVRRAAEDRAGAILHEDEIGDEHGKLRALDHRMLHAQASVVSLLLLRLEFRDRSCRDAGIRR